MPSPPTTNLPRPKSWNELEDICADVLKRLWNDPYTVRHGRSGQKQDGVDIYGHPENLGGASSGKIAAAQCKETERLTMKTIEEEVTKAKKFQPAISEYIVMSSASTNKRKTLPDMDARHQFRGRLRCQKILARTLARPPLRAKLIVGPGSESRRQRMVRRSPLETG